MDATDLLSNAEPTLKVDELVNLCENYDKQLKRLNIDVDDLPEDITVLLNKMANMQYHLNIYKMRDNYLQELSFIKRKSEIDHKINIARLQSDISKSEKELHEIEQKNEVLERFEQALKQRIMSEDEMQRNKDELEKKLKGLQNKMDSFTIPADINIDAFIDKVAILEKSRLKKQ